MGDNFLVVDLIQSSHLNYKGMVVALPPDVRKGSAFPFKILIVSRGYASTFGAQPTRVLESRWKGLAVPHIDGEAEKHAACSIAHNFQMQLFQLLQIHLTRRVDHQVLRRRSLGKRHDVANIFGRHQHHQCAFDS